MKIPILLIRNENSWKMCFDNLIFIFTKNAMETLQQVAEHMSIASTLNYSSKIPKPSTDHKW